MLSRGCIVLLLVLVTGARCQLDVRRSFADGSGTEQHRNINTDIPNLAALFSTLMPNSHRNSISANDTINSTNSSLNERIQTELVSLEEFIPSTESSVISSNVSKPGISEINLIDSQSEASTGDTELSSRKPASFSESDRSFNPSARIGSAREEFQPRSGLVEDIYDYANDFGERISHTPSHSSNANNDKISQTFPSLYLRDQPENLIPFEAVRRGSPPTDRRTFGGTAVDWQPNWPSELVPTPVSINMGMPTESQYIRSSFNRPQPTTVDYSIEKEPITQYYFDLSDASIVSSKLQSSTFIPQPTVLASRIPTQPLSQRFSQSTSLQPSILSVSESNVGTITPVATAQLTLNTGIDINKIYSSAFFPSALPSAIHKSHSDSPTIETVHNDIRENPPLIPGDVDSHMNINPTRVINDSSANSNNITNNESHSEYSLGSDSDYYFPTNSDGVEQDLGFSGSAVRNQDELALGSGNFPDLAFALPTAIPNTSLSPESASVYNSTTGNRKRFAFIPRNSSSEPRKPLWQLLSDKTELDSDRVSPTPVLSDTMFGTDFPVGILSNRVPIQHTLTSVHVNLSSASLASSLEPTKVNPTFHQTSVLHSSSTSNILPSAIDSSTSVQSTKFNVESTTTLKSESNESVNSWKPLTNETLDSSPTEIETVLPVPSLLPTPVVNVPILTGGFTPLVGQRNNDALNTTERNLLASNNSTLNNTDSSIVDLNLAPTNNPSNNTIAQLAPSSTSFAHDTSTSHTTVEFSRSYLESALLHNVPDSVVKFLPSSIHVIPSIPITSTSTSVFGESFTFRPTTPDPKPVIVESTTHGLSSAVLGITPKSSGASGFEDIPTSTTPFPNRFSRPYDNINDTTINPKDEETVDTSTDEYATTFKRKPSTYVYPQEILAVTGPTASTDDSTDVEVEIDDYNTYEGLETTTDSVSETLAETTESVLIPSTGTPETTGSRQHSFTTTRPSSSSTTNKPWFPTTQSTTTSTTTAPITNSTTNTDAPITYFHSSTTKTTEESTPSSKDVRPTTEEESQTDRKPFLTVSSVGAEAVEPTTDMPTQSPNETVLRIPTDMPYIRAQILGESDEFCSKNRNQQYGQLMSSWLQAEIGEEFSVDSSNILFWDPECDDVKHILNPEFQTSQPLVSTSAIHTIHSLDDDDFPTFNEGQRSKRSSISKRQTTEDLNYAETSSLDGNSIPVKEETVSINNSSAINEPDHEIYDYGTEQMNNFYTASFYVIRNGGLDIDLIEAFPLFPKHTNLSEELKHLVKSVQLLELIQPWGGRNILPTANGLGTAGVVAIIVSATLVVITAVALVFFILYRRKRAATNNANYYNKRCTPVSMDAYSVDSVSVYHSFRRRKSRRNRSNRSVKSYMNQGFEDPNGPSHPLDFAQLTHFISDMDGVHEEFGTVPVITPNYDELPANVQDRNRYANVIPVPETRVLLKGFKDNPEKQYINANYVQGPHSEPNYYIATQAPLDCTVGDFWRMVWEQETRVIVMLTDFVERGIDKCADYLPPSQTLDCHRVYGDFQVTLKSRDMQEKFVISGVLLKNLENNLTRELSHLWFTGWPSTGVPNTEKPFISFMLAVRRVRKQNRSKGPIVVHCSPGTGRTGTFLAADHSIRHFEDDRTVDVARTVYTIRRERAGAVQTSEQYSFIYRVINLYASKLSSGNLDSL